MSISNLFGRFSVGICFDRFGRSKALLYILSLSCLGVLLLPVSFAVHSITGVATGICLIAASYGCVSSSTSPVIREAYGDTHFTSNYGVTLTSAMPASLLATVTAVILTRGGSFHMIFIVFGFFAISAFALFFWYEGIVKLIHLDGWRA